MEALPAQTEDLPHMHRLVRAKKYGTWRKWSSIRSCLFSLQLRNLGIFGEYQTNTESGTDSGDLKVFQEKSPQSSPRELPRSPCSIAFFLWSPVGPSPRNGRSYLSAHRPTFHGRPNCRGAAGVQTNLTCGTWSWRVPSMFFTQFTDVLARIPQKYKWCWSFGRIWSDLPGEKVDFILHVPWVTVG